METAIVVPSALYEAAEKRARELGLSLSELAAVALRGVLPDMPGPATPDADLTRRLDEVYAGEDSHLDPALLIAQVGSLAREEW